MFYKKLIIFNDNNNNLEMILVFSSVYLFYFSNACSLSQITITRQVQNNIIFCPQIKNKKVQYNNFGKEKQDISREHLYGRNISL